MNSIVAAYTEIVPIPNHAHRSTVNIITQISQVTINSELMLGYTYIDL